MRLLSAILASVAIIAPPASAQAIPFTKFHFGITPDQAVAAAPHLEWTRNDWGEEGGPLDGAFAHNAAELGGHAWDVTAGEKWTPAGSNKGEVMFEREFVYERTDDCAKAMSETVAVLEPTYGMFGADEDFFNPNSTRYLSKGYQRVQASPKSLMREYRDDHGPMSWETFGKAIGKKHEAWISARLFDEEKVCYLHITLQLPFKRLERK